MIRLHRNKQAFTMVKISLGKISLTLRILYPIWMVVGMLALIYIPSILIVKDNPIETARNISANEDLYRLGVVASLVTQIFAVVIPVLLFWMFKSVSRLQAIFMLTFNLIAVPIAMYSEVHSLQALNFLDDAGLMMEQINLKWTGITIASIFWGLWLLPLGSLVIRSGYFPKFIGYSLYVGSVGYLLGSFLSILSHDRGLLYDISEILTIGEVIFILWFVIKGAKLQGNKKIVN